MPVVNGVKISALTEGTVPLSGTELVPVVQNGTTKRVPSAAFFAFRLGDEMSFVAAAGVNNNVNPGAASRILVDTTAGAATITGFQGGTDGRVLMVTCIGPNELILDNETGTAVNQLYAADDIALPEGTTVFLVYSDALLKWVIV
jgi:hypothetical protein